MTLTDAGARALAAAIIAQAVKDWYLCEAALIGGCGRVDAEDASMSGSPAVRQAMIEDFFKSDWFHVLTDLDGDALVRAMREGPFREFRGNQLLHTERVTADRKHSRKRGPRYAWPFLFERPALRDRLSRNGISQRMLAGELNVSHTVLTRWMKAGIDDALAAQMEAALDRILSRR